MTHYYLKLIRYYLIAFVLSMILLWLPLRRIGWLLTDRCYQHGHKVVYGWSCPRCLLDRYLGK